jgi:hypothetical protein
MPSKQVSVREMSGALKELGFVEIARLRHPEKNIVLTLPTAERYVRLVILRSIESSLVNSHIVEKHRFRKMLDIEG